MRSGKHQLSKKGNHAFSTRNNRVNSVIKIREGRLGSRRCTTIHALGSSDPVKVKAYESASRRFRKTKVSLHISDSDSDNGFEKFETKRCLKKLNIGRKSRKGEEAKTIYIGVIKQIGAKIATPNANNREASQKGGGVCERHPSI